MAIGAIRQRRLINNIVIKDMHMTVYTYNIVLIFLQRTQKFNKWKRDFFNNFSLLYKFLTKQGKTVKI